MMMRTRATVRSKDRFNALDPTEVASRDGPKGASPKSASFQLAPLGRTSSSGCKAPSGIPPDPTSMLTRIAVPRFLSDLHLP